VLSEGAHRTGAGPDLVLQALQHLPETPPDVEAARPVVALL